MTLDEYLTLHPTPWTVHPCGCQDVCWCRTIKSAKSEEDYVVGAGSLNEVEANLLAAAPEMLGILQEIVEDGGDIGYFTFEKIERAIAKARGVSHE